MTQQQLIEKQRKQREDIDWINAKFSRPGAWSIGKELGENDSFVALGIRNAKISPRQDAAPLPTAAELVQDPQDAEAYAALMRELPVHNEEDDADVVAAFKELDEFLEAAEAPDEETPSKKPKQK
jgi:hypothetical protein